MQKAVLMLLNFMICLPQAVIPQSLRPRLRPGSLPGGRSLSRQKAATQLARLVLDLVEAVLAVRHGRHFAQAIDSGRPDQAAVAVASPGIADVSPIREPCELCRWH